MSCKSALSAALFYCYKASNNWQFFRSPVRFPHQDQTLIRWGPSWLVRIFWSLDLSDLLPKFIMPAVSDFCYTLRGFSCVEPCTCRAGEQKIVCVTLLAQSGQKMMPVNCIWKKIQEKSSVFTNIFIQKNVKFLASS